ncbi:Uncharacterized protein FWK35_00029282 [Aphis craccivora]|uniref:Uncharacterized protein n=1 Tax=Aphis craccivora TaxID=307492 RepID=A0A6G0Y9V6_APHCR|nr:Uncharacterized protein FWK35_00029282 [Aphis craccivora]
MYIELAKLAGLYQRGGVSCSLLKCLENISFPIHSSCWMDIVSHNYVQFSKKNILSSSLNAKHSTSFKNILYVVLASIEISINKLVNQSNIFHALVVEFGSNNYIIISVITNQKQNETQKIHVEISETDSTSKKLILRLSNIQIDGSLYSYADDTALLISDNTWDSVTKKAEKSLKKSRYLVFKQ